MTPSPLVEIRSISKTFGGVRALRGVCFSIAPGEVHALCGENGAGKSTLNKVLSGSCVPDAATNGEGQVLVDGHPLRFGSVAEAEAAGIAIIHQESTAFLHLNSEDNVFIGREPRRFRGMLLDRASMRRQTRALLERLGERFDTRRTLSELTVAQRQMVGIARALGRSCRLLIMDEPTASLSARETRVLFDIIRQLRRDGVSILYVSHRLEEVFELADRVTVLRDGECVGTRPVGEVGKPDLIKMMVGRAVAETERSGASASEEGEALLEVRGLTREGVFRDVSFCVREGEIVGLAGLVGAGRSEVARAIFGIDAVDAGSARIAGAEAPLGSTREAIARGVSLVPEDRQRQGLALPMGVAENLSLAVLGAVSRHGVLSRRLEEDLAERLMSDLSIRAASSRVAVETLSGGNQQKVMLGKWLASEPRVLILDEPTRGVDVGAKAEVHRLIRELAEQREGRPGIAILLISSELPEILALSDRIVVMREGAVAGELARDEATQEKILDLALPEADAERDNAEDLSEPKRMSNAWQAIGRVARKREFGVFALLLLTVAIVAGVNPAFLSGENIRDMLVKCAPAAIVACGLTLVIVTREIDISVGSLMGLLAALLGILTSTERAGLPVAFGVGSTLIAGALIGCLTGALVAVARVPSIIVTLGMLTALRGATEIAMGGEWIGALPAGLRFFGTGAWLGVPVSVWAALGAIGLTSLLARHTALGRRIYAVGSSPRSAVLAGVSPRRIRMFVFGYVGLLTALATIVSVPQLSVIGSGVGSGFELLVVTCVVVGGTSISGGKGSVLGSMLGVLLLGIVATVLIFLRLGEMSTYWERAIQGAFILAAVLADHLARSRSREEEAL